ncbi:MAG TPA: hypothetical protein VFK39_14415 [Gemmatimonadaceae bacterium]|nr:hypothetical protein [Gemmatimonadaceae bacterium]
MKSMRSLVFAALILAAPAAAAQSVDSRCSDPAFVGAAHEGGDACQKVVDIYRYLGNQLGTLVSGGNAVLGQGGTLGGLPHFTVQLRANVMRASIPDVGATSIAIGAPRQSTYDVDEKWVAIPQVDASLGIFRGFPVGVTHVGGVDAIASAAYVPDVTSGSVGISSPDGSLKLGYGARLGIMSESILTPGISVTYLERELPDITITAREGSNTLTVSALHVRARSWRVVASKSFVVFGLAAGIGRDEYRTTSALTYDVEGARPQRPLELEISPGRTNMFVDLSITPFPFVRLAGELGRVSGGDLQTYNRFEPAVGDARLYGSVGLRLGF